MRKISFYTIYCGVFLLVMSILNMATPKPSPVRAENRIERQIAVIKGSMLIALAGLAASFTGLAALIVSKK